MTASLTSSSLNRLQDWLREPDHAEHFGTSQILDWINRRPTHIVPAFLNHQYRIGPNAMQAVFRQHGLTDLSDMQAVLDAVEAALASDQTEAGRLREALAVARRAILKAAQDTLWCDDSPAETVVDRIDSLVPHSDEPAA